MNRVDAVAARCYSGCVRALPASRILLLVVSIPLLFLASCGQDTATIEAREDQFPLMVKAQARVKAREIEEAIDLYKEAVAERPDLAKAHLNLGLLFEEHRKDYLRAIYHYETYLELRPNTDKRLLVEELIRVARMSYAASLPDRPSEAVEAIAVIQRKLETTEGELEEARAEIEDLRAQLQAAHRPPDTGRTARTAVSGGSPGREGAAGAGETVYVVRPRDTLSSIARKVYGDSSRWRRIYDANNDTLKRPEDLREGQVLRIPQG